MDNLPQGLFFGAAGNGQSTVPPAVTLEVNAPFSGELSGSYDFRLEQLSESGSSSPPNPWATAYSSGPKPSYPLPFSRIVPRAQFAIEPLKPMSGMVKGMDESLSEIIIPGVPYFRTRGPMPPADPAAGRTGISGLDDYCIAPLTSWESEVDIQRLKSPVRLMCLLTFEFY